MGYRCTDLCYVLGQTRSAGQALRSILEINIPGNGVPVSASPAVYGVRHSTPFLHQSTHVDQPARRSRGVFSRQERRRCLCDPASTADLRFHRLSIARSAQKIPVCLTIPVLLSALRVMHYSPSRDLLPSPPSYVLFQAGRNPTGGDHLDPRHGVTFSRSPFVLVWCREGGLEASACSAVPKGRALDCAKRYHRA